MVILLRFLGRQALRRGLFGGSPGWVVVGAFVALYRLAQRAKQSEQRVLFSGEVSPSRALVISPVVRGKS